MANGSQMSPFSAATPERRSPAASATTMCCAGERLSPRQDVDDVVKPHLYVIVRRLPANNNLSRARASISSRRAGEE